MHITSDGPIACARPRLHSQCRHAGHGGPQLEGGGGQSPLAQRAAAAIAEEEHLNWSVWLQISSTVIARCLLLLRAYICQTSADSSYPALNAKHGMSESHDICTDHVAVFDL